MNIIKFIRLLFVLFTMALSATIKSELRVSTSDWSTAETLAAIEHPPVSVGDKRAYETWINFPVLTDKTQDSGLRFQPNLEKLRQIKPDLFIQSPWFSHLKAQFETIAPVKEITFALKEGITYSNTVTQTLKLGAMVNALDAAKKLVSQTESQFEKQKNSVKQYDDKSLAIVQFVDARHLRIYGSTSLYHQVLLKLGLKNAWAGSSNEWGFANITLADLAKLPPNTLLIIVKPHPSNVYKSLLKSKLWKRLPFSKVENIIILPPCWSYGALPAMQNFANQLTHHIMLNKESAW